MATIMVDKLMELVSKENIYSDNNNNNITPCKELIIKINKNEKYDISRKDLVNNLVCGYLSLSDIDIQLDVHGKLKFIEFI